MDNNEDPGLTWFAAFLQGAAASSADVREVWAGPGAPGRAELTVRLHDGQELLVQIAEGHCPDATGQDRTVPKVAARYRTGQRLGACVCGVGSRSDLHSLGCPGDQCGLCGTPAECTAAAVCLGPVSQRTAPRLPAPCPSCGPGDNCAECTGDKTGWTGTGGRTLADVVAEPGACLGPGCNHAGHQEPPLRTGDSA